jgi:hypothetical protein
MIYFAYQMIYFTYKINIFAYKIKYFTDKIKYLTDKIKYLAYQIEYFTHQIEYLAHQIEYSSHQMLFISYQIVLRASQIEIITLFRAGTSRMFAMYVNVFLMLIAFRGETADQMSGMGEMRCRNCNLNEWKGKQINFFSPHVG